MPRMKDRNLQSSLLNDCFFILLRQVKMKDNPQILGFALGGGAFRGTAHIGVLKALEE